MSRKLYILPLNNKFDVSIFNNLLSYVSDEKAVEIKKLYYNMDKKLSLYAQVAVKLIVQKEFGIDIDKISIVNDDLGKPYIEGHEKIFFNISHTHNVIAIAFSDNKVGVDIEKETENSVGIAKRFFTEEEYEYIVEISEEPMKAFLEIWTKKEAFVKYLGLGLRKPLDDFCVVNDSLKDKFLTLQRENCVVSYYDGNDKDGVEIIKLTEKEIEKLELIY